MRTLTAQLTLILLALASPASAQEASAPGHYEPLYQALWAAVNERYYDPYLRGVDWVGLRERYLSRARSTRTDDEFAALAEAMLAEIGSSHLFVTRPDTSTGSTGIGARWAEVGGARIVTDVALLSDAWRQGVRPGDRLLTSPDVVRGALGSLATVEVEHCTGRRERISVRREQAFWPPERPGFRWRQLRTSTADRIGYLRIDRFDDGAADLADRAMSDLGDSRALIIDLRGNSGGNNSALRLASYFAPGAEAAIVLLARPYLSALGHPPTVRDIAGVPRVDRAYTDEAVFAAVASHGGGAAFWTEQVEHRYVRPVFLLIGPGTGSAGEGFAWYMRLRTSARLIGRRTAGALLSSESVEIGQGWSVTLPVHGLWGPDGDRAVQPQVEVAWSRGDLCSGRDPDLETALRLAGIAS